MGVSVTIRFDYPWNEEIEDENEIEESLMELSPEELILVAQRTGRPINIDIEVY